MTLGLCNLRAFQWNVEPEVPDVLIAEDSSGTNSDRVNAKIEEILKTHNGKNIQFKTFTGRADWFEVKTLADIDTYKDSTFDEKVENKWASILRQIKQVHHLYTKATTVYLLSDMQNTKDILDREFTELSTYPPNAKLKLVFCQIGKSETSYFQKSEQRTLGQKVRISHCTI